MSKLRHINVTYSWLLFFISHLDKSYTLYYPSFLWSVLMQISFKSSWMGLSLKVAWWFLSEFPTKFLRILCRISLLSVGKLYLSTVYFFSSGNTWWHSYCKLYWREPLNFTSCDEPWFRLWWHFGEKQVPFIAKEKYKVFVW